MSVRKITTSKVTVRGGYLDPRSRGSDEWGKCWLGVRGPGPARFN